MIVVPYTPWRDIFTRLAITLLVIFLCAGVYFYGHYRGVMENGDARAERDQFSLQLQENQLHLAQLEQELINSQQANIVDKQALEEIRQTIVTQRETIAQLEEDVLFYKQIMSPENDETGLMIGQLDLNRTESENVVRYRLELKQVGNNESLIAGHVNVNILGTQDNQEIAIPLRNLTEEVEELDIKLQFRYFQNIEGELVLTEDFVPNGVQIVAQSTGNNAKTVQKSFAWVLE